ncbi:MAG: S-layer homology domain-containing protein, partial [Candidatus Peribacter sp.]
MQETDNPSLAKQIFSSFRWLDEENTPAIQYLLDHGIASGYPDGSFKPERTINRAEFTKIVVGAVYDAAKINECPALSSVSPFPDVSADDWF